MIQDSSLPSYNVCEGSVPNIGSRFRHPVLANPCIDNVTRDLTLRQHSTSAEYTFTTVRFNAYGLRQIVSDRVAAEAQLERTQCAAGASLASRNSRHAAQRPTSSELCSNTMLQLHRDKPFCCCEHLQWGPSSGRSQCAAVSYRLLRLQAPKPLSFSL